MAFSLSSWFKGKPTDAESEGTESAHAHATAPAPSAPPPSSVRTVRPSVAPQSAPPPARMTNRVPISLPTSRPPASAKVTATAPPPRKVSFSAGGPSPEPVRPAPAPSFTPPAPDVTISLKIGDFIDRLPVSLVQRGSYDLHKRVEFPASELYSDLLKGRASVPASVIYQRCPEVFSRPVTQTEDVEVQLPLQKLVEQMGAALSTRPDQVGEENVGEIETPFLQVAMEDNARLPTAAGTAAGAVRPPAGLLAAESFRPTGAPVDETIGDASPIPVPVQRHRTGHVSTIMSVKNPAEMAQGPAAPAAPTAAGPIIPGKRPPSTVRASVAGGKIRLSGPSTISRISPVTDPVVPATPPGVPGIPSSKSQRIQLPIQPAAPAVSPSHQVAKKTARIQIPPISLRTGGPNATPRQGAVPPPPTAPVPLAGPGAPTAPELRPGLGKEAPAITFRTSPPPPPTVRPAPVAITPPRTPAFPPPSFPPVPAPPAPVAPAPALADDRKIELGLAAILRSLPSSMLSGDASSIADDVRVVLPFAMIEPQLSQGRVTIPRGTFLQAVPEAHRQILASDEQGTEIPLPLQEVFQNLPSNALSMRADQVTEETGAHYPTPFSQKADEDAQRFSGSATVPAPPAPAILPLTEAVPPAPEAKSEERAEAAVEVPPATPMASAAPADATPLTEPAVEETRRDIPLDLAGETAAVVPSEPVPESKDAVLDKPMEMRDAPLTVEVPPAETPAAQAPPVDAPVALPEIAPAEPVAQVETPVLPPVEERLPEPVAAETPAPAPEAASVADTAPILPPLPALPVKEPEASRAPVRPRPSQEGVLQALFMTEEELDAKTIVKLVCQLPAVTGCAVMFEDGLRLAGNFPDGDTEGFSAMAAPLYKKGARFVSELELGNLLTFTLHTDQGLLSFFMHDNVCLSVRHTGRGFMPGVQEKLQVVARELARMYSTAAQEH